MTSILCPGCARHTYTDQLCTHSTPTCAGCCWEQGHEERR